MTSQHSPEVSSSPHDRDSRNFVRTFLFGDSDVHKDGILETVIAASGQWLGVPELTRQMKIELMPKELTERAFRIAGAP
jgi:hypothetical protein